MIAARSWGLGGSVVGHAGRMNRVPPSGSCLGARGSQALPGEAAHLAVR